MVVVWAEVKDAGRAGIANAVRLSVPTETSKTMKTLGGNTPGVFNYFCNFLQERLKNMKIAITATGPSLDDQVEARFGRALYYLFVNTDSMDFEAVRNPNAELGGGAGIQSAQLMSQYGVQHVLTGNCGPNAFQVFSAAGIHVITGVSGIARQAAEQFKKGVLNSSAQPNVESHFGMGGGRGMGTGRGRGMGGGRGMGMGGGQAGFPNAIPQQNTSAEDETAALEEEARLLEKRLKEIKEQTHKIKEGQK